MKIHFCYLLLLTISLSFSTSVVAFEKKQCFSVEYSTVATGECLDKEYRATDATLKNALSQLLTRVQGMTFWDGNVELDRKAKRNVISALREADNKWRALVKAECQVLLKSQYVGGSSDENYARNCLITRTKERIKFLRENEVYSAYWSK